jgi:hypothetical protein
MRGFTARFKSVRRFPLALLLCGSDPSTRPASDPGEPKGREREQNLVRPKALKLLGLTWSFG